MTQTLTPLEVMSRIQNKYDLYADELDAEGRLVLAISFGSSYRAPVQNVNQARIWLSRHGLLLKEVGAQLPVGGVYVGREKAWIWKSTYAHTQIGKYYVFHAVPIDSPQSVIEAQNSPPKENEHARMMRFFCGVGPTDPSKLPPPPKVLGRSWDDWVDD